MLYAFSWNKKEVARMYGVESFPISLQMYTLWDPRSSQEKYYNIKVYEVVKNW
jgi:hypothetical protein